MSRAKRSSAKDQLQLSKSLLKDTQNKLRKVTIPMPPQLETKKLSLKKGALVQEGPQVIKFKANPAPSHSTNAPTFKPSLQSRKIDTKPFALKGERLSEKFKQKFSLCVQKEQAELEERKKFKARKPAYLNTVRKSCLRNFETIFRVNF